jgi:glycerophosphoryl diester phosphodiesterase
MEGWDEDWRKKMGQVKACTLSVDESLLTPERVEVLKSLRLPLLAYTVNDPARAKELLSWGVTAVYSDDPRLVMNAL